jgi:hypothetical protein
MHVPANDVDHFSIVDTVPGVISTEGEIFFCSCLLDRLTCSGDANSDTIQIIL